jgi:hypothetical protein
MWQMDRDDGDGRYAQQRHLGCRAPNSMLWPLHVSLGSGGAWVEVLKDQLSLIFGQPAKKTRCVAFSIVEIFGLHNDWCANFPAFAPVRILCTNAAIWGCSGFRYDLPT